MKSITSFFFVALFVTVSQAQSVFEKNLFDEKEEVQTFLLLIDNDGGISQISSIPIFQCSNVVTPVVEVENYGTKTLESATIQYQVDGGDPQHLFWTGKLEPFFTEEVVLPHIMVTEGAHVLDVKVTEANGSLDFNNANNASIEFNIVGTGSYLPVKEEFSGVQLPAGFFIHNPDQGATWDLFNFPLVNGSFARSIRMPFYFNQSEADVDYFFTTNFNFSQASAPVLTFDIAYAYYSEVYWDQLQIYASLNCGNSWDLLYDKSKDELATAPANDVTFIPTLSQWRNEVIDLTAYAGQSSLLIRMDAINGHGNNLYIDNFSVSDLTDVEVVKEAMIFLSPNPVANDLNVTLPVELSGEIKVINALGQLMIHKTFDHQTKLLLDVSGLAGGEYIILFAGSENKINTSKLLILR